MTPDAAIQWHAQIDSTNEEARRLTQAGMYGPLWIAGRMQTAGRGRLGRNWSSPTGNLFCTALFLEPGGLPVATRYPFASGLAVVDVCTALVPGADVRLKWPNDVRCDGAKICGILVEAGQAPGSAAWIAAGMGVNVAMTPPDAGQSATSLRDLGAHPGIEADNVLEMLVPAFAKRIAQAREDFPALLKDWENYAEGLGETVSVGKGETARRGTFRGLAPDGGLKMELPDGTVHTVRAGDVELVKERR